LWPNLGYSKEYRGIPLPPPLPLTNKIIDDAFRKVDGAGCVTAARPVESGRVFTTRLYIHRSKHFGTHNGGTNHQNGHQKRSILHTATDPTSRSPSASNKTTHA
jgi:hypothetical protein